MTWSIAKQDTFPDLGRLLLRTAASLDCAGKATY